jgi:hypothetical protein
MPVTRGEICGEELASSGSVNIPIMHGDHWSHWRHWVGEVDFL